MTQEEKELLLKDLCARLPYGVKFECSKNVYIAKGLDLIVTDEGDWEYAVTTKGSEPIEINFIKPYLRPMSSMTEEEKEELVDFGLAYWDMGKHTDEDGNVIIYGGKEFQLLPDIETYEWLNEHHFDYRGMIEKGIAIKVTEENNPYEN